MANDPMDVSLSVKSILLYIMKSLRTDKFVWRILINELGLSQMTQSKSGPIYGTAVTTLSFFNGF